MLAYITRRILSVVPTIVGVVVIVFVLVRLTGDPARFVLGDLATDEAVSAFRATHGLDRPLLAQFRSYLGGLLKGELGVSVRYNQSVGRLFAERWPYTLQLGCASFLVSAVLGISLGIYSALHAGGLADRLIRYSALVAQAVPGFYLGLLLIIGIAVKVSWIPAVGAGSIRHLLLPTISVSAYFTALIVRFTRSNMLDALNQDYVRTAWAKGLGRQVILWKHVFRNSLIVVLTLLATQIKTLFSGVVVTETVFGWPGIGRLAAQAIMSRDYAVIQGLIVVFTVAVILVNLAIDMAYTFLDPRITYS